MVKSMTAGSPLKLILQFSLPLLAGNLVQQTYNMMDAIIVGRFLGTNALASVGASSSVQFLILGFCIGLCAGFGVPVAQNFGAKKYEQMRRCIAHAAMWCVLGAIVLTTVVALLTAPILHLMQTSADIFNDAYAYLLIIFLGIPFVLLYNLLSSILRAVGDSKTPFFFLLLSAVMNIFLDIFCIVVLHWGCAGAAIATVISEAVSGILCLLLIHLKFDILRPKKEERKFDRKYFRYMISMGAPMGLQYSITAIGSMIMQSANNSLGSIYVSGFTAGTRIKQFALCPFDALATGTSTFASQNYGAGNASRVRKGIREGMIAGVLYGLFMGFLMIRFGRNAAGMFLSEGAANADQVLDAAARYLRAMGYFLWVLGILNVARYCTQGLGFSGRAVFSGVVEMIARTVVSFAFVPVYGYAAICYADQTAWVSAACYSLCTCIWAVHRISAELTRRRSAGSRN